LSPKTRDLDDAQKRFAALAVIAGELARYQDPAQLMQHVCTSARQITLGSHAFLWILAADGASIESVISSGLEEGFAATLQAPSLNTALMQSIVVDRKVVRRRNPGGRPSAIGLPDDHLPVYSLLGVPVASPSRVHGWLSIRNKIGAAEFTEVDEQTALALGAIAGAAFDNARMIDDLKREHVALRRGEERTIYALGAARMGIFEVDLATMRLTWSDTLARVFGLDPRQAPADIGEFLGLIHAEDREAVGKSFAENVRSGTDYLGEFRVVWPDGSLHWIAGRAHLFREGDGDAGRFIGVGMDITERKALENAIAEQRLRVLKATMRTVEDIVGNCFSSLQEIRIDAEGLLPEATLNVFDDTMSESLANLRALGNLESTPEKQMGIGVGIDYDRPPVR
jgi:PAS domain S-box-containing protein